jgi:hypothetical protein
LILVSDLDAAVFNLEGNILLESRILADYTHSTLNCCIILRYILFSNL